MNVKRIGQVQIMIRCVVWARTVSPVRRDLTATRWIARPVCIATEQGIVNGSG